MKLIISNCKFFQYFVFTTIILFLATNSFAQKSDTELVKICFDNYKNAILTDKGDDAVKFVDEKTIKYYEDVLVLIKNADSVKLANTSLMDRFMVLAVRHRVDKEKILSFDGKGLLVYAIESGMVGKNGVVGTSIGEVTISKDFAKGQIVANGEVAPYYFHFYKTEGQWKLNLTSLFTLANVAFKNMIEESGETEKDFFFSLLEIMNGKKVSNSIWNPISKTDN